MPRQLKADLLADEATGPTIFLNYFLINYKHFSRDRIFSVRGIPRADLWPEFHKLPKWSQFNFPAYTEMPWPQVEPALAQLGEAGRKLLDQFLQVMKFY